jgi:indole-3-glycerol phosphate synthase/phosphoribosylanthranilate isomerase
MTDILNDIVARRRIDVESKTVPLSEWKARHRERDDFRPFHKVLRANRFMPGVASVIAEIKRSSPAKGLFAPHLDPEESAGLYEFGGAACLSVLTEPHYFFGSMDDLIAARSVCHLPVLQKDFIVTEYQVWEAAVHADAMLLIARCLERQQLAELHHLATELGLDVLVEVFDEEDLDKIAPFHFPLIGINHRNLRTMDIDLERSGDLVSRFAPDQTIVAASGIRTRSDIESLMRTGIRAFLVGESLSTQPEPHNLLRTLVHGDGAFVKICGITTPAAAIACFEAGASMIGLVHYPPSPRHIDAEQIKNILDAVEPFLLFANRDVVLVVVDQLPEEIDSRINYLQVYGHIDSNEQERDDLPSGMIPVIKDAETIAGLCQACKEKPCAPGQTFLAGIAYLGYAQPHVESSCNCSSASPAYYCLEASQGAMPGGNGAAWNWSQAKPFCERFPTMIAGGITPENVAEVLRLAKPCGIDISSGVESSPGVKDMDKVRRLMDNAHQAILR